MRILVPATLPSRVAPTAVATAAAGQTNPPRLSPACIAALTPVTCLTSAHRKTGGTAAGSVCHEPRTYSPGVRNQRVDMPSAEETLGPVIPRATDLRTGAVTPDAEPGAASPPTLHPAPGTRHPAPGTRHPAPNPSCGRWLSAGWQPGPRVPRAWVGRGAGCDVCGIQPQEHASPGPGLRTGPMVDHSRGLHTPQRQERPVRRPRTARRTCGLAQGLDRTNGFRRP